MNLLSNLREQIYRYRVEYLKKEENYQILIGEHEAIYQALVERNADAAVAAIHEHVKNQAYAVKEVIIRQG
jgi:DNA-binding GntR family transcriptional regulator